MRHVRRNPEFFLLANMVGAMVLILYLLHPLILDYYLFMHPDVVSYLINIGLGLS